MVFLGMLVIVGLSGSSLEAIESLMTDPDNPSYLPVIRILTAMNQVGAFLVSTWIFVRMFGMQSVEGLYLRRFAPALWVVVPVLMLAASPLIDLSYRFNVWIIPEGSWLEGLFKPLEEGGETVTKAILQMDDLPGFLLNMLIIAILPALGEELAFRGVLQNQLAKSFKNIHLAVWVGALLFSAYHMQFYGFIPRMLMGALFGYLVIWTGSLWPSILAHLMNNGTAVYIAWEAQQNPDFNRDELLASSQMPELPWIAGGAVVFALSIFFIRRDSKWKDIKAAYTHWKRIEIGAD